MKVNIPMTIKKRIVIVSVMFAIVTVVMLGKGK